MTDAIEALKNWQTGQWTGSAEGIRRRDFLIRLGALWKPLFLAHLPVRLPAFGSAACQPCQPASLMPVII